MRVLVTCWKDPAIHTLLTDDMVAAGELVRSGSSTSRIVGVDAVLHCDWLDRGTFQQLVDYNLGRSIALAARCEAGGVPLAFYQADWMRGMGGRVRQTLDMAREVLVNEYHARWLMDSEAIHDRMLDLVERSLR